ncbi:hypothetical protein V1527DRAFT_472845, partial [Lipomyces starkeyi]
MLIAIDHLAARRLRLAELSNCPSRGWLRRKVEKVALLEGRTLSQTVKTKSMSWLMQRILTQQPGPLTRMHFKLSPSGKSGRQALSQVCSLFLILPQMERLEQKAQRTIEKIRIGPFCPKKFLSKSGTNRAFSILPQFSFPTRYLPVDNRVLRELLSTLWRRVYHPFPHQLPESARQGVFMAAARQEFDSHHAEWWWRLFRLHRIQGIHIPGIPLPASLPSRETPRPIVESRRPSTVFGLALRETSRPRKRMSWWPAALVSLGRRTAPVKKLRKHLRRYVTVVPVDEYRTSRVCSKHIEEQRERTDLGEKEDEGGNKVNSRGG